MKNRILILGILFLSMMFTSCLKDLDVKPKDPSSVMADNLNDNPDYLKGFLGKIYASFMVSGQGGNLPDDIVAADGNFFTTMRALWNLQELPTDEAICAWGDAGIADLNTQTWSPENLFLTALYQRLGLSITYANEFIRDTQGSTDPDVKRYIAEARFLRALAYYWDLDLFANPPFTTEKNPVGNFFPKQLSPDMSVARVKLFNYIVNELHAVEPELSDPGTSSTQADRGAAWMLLARLYLNAEVYTGTAKWDSCKIYCDKVINSGAYSLATDYRQNFSADNDSYSNPEMIFAWEQDGIYTQGYVGTTFIIESSSDSKYIRAEEFHGLTSNTNWNGNRATKQFLNVMIDTLTTYGGSAIPTNDSLFTACPDKRVYLKRKKDLDIPSASSSGDYGVGVYKFTAKNTDGSQAADYNPAFASTDYPVFRLADAYLMRAEALFRLNNSADAVKDINLVRERAYGNTSGDITAGQLNAQFILDERGREFYYEGQRRTDLIRFGKFTDGNYNWAWKGGVMDGTNTDTHFNVYPIPGAEVSANPNITQNPGY
ncbi:MAG: RagB/SusD family nutrient uptake outer membrane protein [Chlorobi bacterium]|nr:RagB/SusD family nutrient uptake outer membrane protein [Chlorobiota bacterium]